MKNIIKHLRRNLTNAERLLWRYLRAKQMEGYKFRRQQPIGRYVVDLVCFEKRIVIEVDGGQHSVQAQVDKDKERDHWWDNEVLQNIDGVLEIIRDNLTRHPPLSPSHQGRRINTWDKRD